MFLLSLDKNSIDKSETLSIIIKGFDSLKDQAIQNISLNILQMLFLLFFYL